MNYARNLPAGWLWRGPIRTLQGAAAGSYGLLRRGALLRLLAEALADDGGHDLSGLRPIYTTKTAKEGRNVIIRGS